MKKILLLMLTLITLGFTAAPVSAQTIWDGTADISWYDASETSFDISTPEQLAGVAQLVNSGATTFNGITLNLTADLWLNADNDSTNNWTPIGGSATATGEEQSSGNAFRGVFNAHGHSIYNLYCEKSSYFHAGLFGCIQNPCTIDSLVMMNPVVKSQGMMGAITGMTRSGGTIYIRYCLVINGRLQGGSGNNIGFMVGANYPNSSGTQIQNCGATGTITGNYVGGLGGNSQNETFTNCYFAGSISGSPAGGIAAYSGTINNCYSYVTNQPSSGNGTVVTDEEMQSEEMITNLGDAFKMDNGVNNGYPIMSYMAGVDPIAAEICQGESITITAFGYDSYAWSTGATTESITVSPTTTSTYTVTCTSNGVATTLTSTITVYPQAIITASVVPSADGQAHATLNAESFTVGCGSSDNITLVVTPDPNYRVYRVTLNGAEIYGDDFGEGQVSISVNPGGTLGEVKVFVSNEYHVNILELLDTGDTIHVSSLVQPYGSNGVYTVLAGNDQTFVFNNTARYVLVDAEIDGASQGVIASYEFNNIHENHQIVVTYADSCGIFALPFFEGFESVSSGLPECYDKNHANSSYPTVNNYYPYQGNSIYVYNYSYSESSNEVPCLILPKVDNQINISELMVQFYGRANSADGYFVVGVMSDPTDMSTFTSVQAINPTNTSGTYQQYTAYLGNYDGEGHYIAIKMPVNAYCLLGIDNLTVDYAPLCSPVTGLSTSDVYGSNATLTWNPTTVGEVSEYNVYVYDNVTETEVTYTTTETSYLLTDLNELTSYTVGVFTSCTNGQTSDTMFVSFMTPCNNPVNYSVGESTTTNSYLPTYIYYGNTYSQQIVTADVFESTPNDFASISLKDNTNSPTVRSCDIYLAHVPADTTLSNGWILPDPANDFYFTQVFSGDVQFGSGSWVKIDFDTVFPYNGTDNVLVVFNDHTNSYTSSHTYDVIGNSNTNAMARYAYRDNTPYDVSNPNVTGTLLNVVNTFRFSYCDESSCISPNTLTTSNVTENSVDLNWVSVGSENSWEVEYKTADETEWTSAGYVSSTSTTLTDLESNTVYSVRVRALCSSSESSPWSESVSFRTQCDAISSLPYSTSFEDVIGDYVYCWSRLASDPSHMVYRYNSSTYAHTGNGCLDFSYTPNCWTVAIMPAFDGSIPVNSLMLDFWLDKTGNSGYFEVGVMTDPEDGSTFEVVDTIESTIIGNSADYFEHIIISLENYSGSGQYVAFRASNAAGCGYRMDDLLVSEIPTCMYPTNLQALSSTNESVTLSWTEMGDATAWNIMYGETGFDPEEGGDIAIADAETFTVTGLTNVTTYDFYVQADCGGLQSQWVGPVTMTTGTYTFGTNGSDTLTTCSVVLYDDGGANGDYSLSSNYTVVIYPETEGSGLSISGTVNTYGSYSYYNGVVTIYGGVGTFGTVLGTYSGTQTVNLAYGGPVTINFTTGSYYNYPGFELLVQCTECFPPSDVTMSDQTLDGVTVSWNGNADSYAIYLSGAMSGYYTTTGNSYTFTGLNSSSSYSVQVRALCGSDSSLLSPAVNFNTACGAITITAENPWFEDFEGYTGGGAQPFVCWDTPITEVVDNGTSPFVYCGHSPSCHSGSNSAELKGTSNMVVLPEFTNDLHDLRLSFWATTTNTSNYGTVEIGVVTDVFDPTSFELLGPAGTPGPRGSSGSGHGNYMGPFDFNGVQATSGRIAIKFTGYSGLSWNLDDFTVELVPGCPSPVKTSVTATNIDGHNATISFTDNDPDHSSWTVYYREHNAAADDPWMSVVTSTTTVDLNSLDPETTYDVYVITNCAVPDEVADATNTIQFTTLVACPAPQNITVSNIGMTSATLSWFSNADSFTIEYGESGFTQGNGTIVNVTTTTYDLTGLTSGTSYTVYVTADCGTDGSSTSASVNFNTNLCEVADQCVYTFNLTDSYGDGWNGGYLTVQQNGITVTTVGMTSGSSSTVNVTLCDNASTSLLWNTGSFDAEPGFTLVAPDGTELYTVSGMSGYSPYMFTTDCGGSGPVITDPTVTTGAASNIAQTTATLNGTINNPDNVTITAKGFEWKTTVGGTYTPVTVTGNNLTYDLTNLTANTGYTYKAFITFNGTTVYGDEVTFTTLEQGQLTEPSATTNPATNVTQTTATLNGAITNPDNVTITAQGFEWKAASASTYTVLNATGSTMSSTLNNLTANTDYTYRAFVTTANGTHYGSDVTFTTLPEEVEPCDVPTNLHATDIQNESIAIAWDANANVNSWNVQYRPAENGQWTQVTVNTNSHTITNLTGKTNYEIQVQANCGDGNLSDWSASITAQTTDVGIVNYLENSITLFPNPANDVVNVQCTMNNVQLESVEVIDVYGKVVRSVVWANNYSPMPIRINVSGLANGMYFVRVTTDEGVATKTFIKK
ncbi:MAG: fibronectin type III domain-containing protein [Bacteroidales bacterium]|nr:fibronectin type III domain-containing protein [Bacteroidales bacterium]